MTCSEGKKYIGNYPPYVQNTSKHKSNDTDCSVSDTVIDPSNSTEDEYKGILSFVSNRR